MGRDMDHARFQFQSEFHGDLKVIGEPAVFQRSSGLWKITWKFRIQSGIKYSTP